MSSVVRRRLASAESAPALRALREWTPVDVPLGSLHPGDVGWHLRSADATVIRWADTEGGAPAAVGFLDGGVLRVTPAPGADLGALAADAQELLTPGNDACDGLAVPGWRRDESESWVVLTWAPRAVSSRAAPVGENDVADRVLIQRSAFRNSTFTSEKWHAMKNSPAGGLAIDLIVRTPEGEPAAAATGWFAGAGRCGLLEPVGTHPDHRGRGYGRDAVLGACAALVERGASAVAVATPASYVGAVALYKSAGFTVVRENRDWIRG